MNVITQYLLFIGAGLYLMAAVMFFYLWVRAKTVVDGTGVLFLRVLTFSLSLGSLIIFLIRVLSEYGPLDILTARAIAVINPILLVGVALYFKHLIHSGRH